MVDKPEIENSKYRLLGFEKAKGLAVIMVISTSRVIKVKLVDLLRSEIMDNLSKREIKDVYRKYYSDGAALTVYDVSDRHEQSWMVYVVLNLMLFALYIAANVSAAKLVYLEFFDVVVPPAVFLYPLTFLIVDMLNEFFGLRLARRAILFAFVSNVFILVLLSGTSLLPGLSGWQLDGPYNEVIAHVSSVLIASSVSFLFSEYVNSYLLSKIKELTSSRYLFLRVFWSTFFAVIIDSFIFCFIAFYGKMENSDILSLVYVQIVIKMCFAVFNIFPAYGVRSLYRTYVAKAQAA
jgi:uncharacterized integral membrane protein (TIGR00697 family)